MNSEMQAKKIEAAPGRLVVISGPSGVGKTSVAHLLLKDSKIVRATTATTRAPRDGEVDGEDYFFYARDQFLKDLDQGEFLEHAEVYGRFYGTPIGPLLKQLEAGLLVVLLIDVQGVMTLINDSIPASYVFIEAPSLEQLEARLRSRGSESAEDLQARLEAARTEMGCRGSFDHCIVNDNLEQAHLDIRECLGLQN